MRGTVMAAGMAVVGVALVANALITVMTDGLRGPALASTEGESPALSASIAHAGSIDDAARELDLIRPPRPKQASDFTVSLLGGETLKLARQRGKPVLVNFWATVPYRGKKPAGTEKGPYVIYDPAARRLVQIHSPL